MDRRHLVGGAVALVVVAAAVGAVAVPALFQAQKANNTTSTYYYSASLGTNATLTNATFYLPLPVDPDGSPTVDDVRVTSYDGPEIDWTTRTVETDRGPMLSLSADEVIGEGRYYLRNENGSLARPGTITRDEAPEDMTGLSLDPALTSYEVSAQVTVESFGNGIENGTIETRYPEGNSSMLSATYAESDDCVADWGGEYQTCTAFRADLYASYDAESDAIVRVGSVELWGINEWGWFFANSFNEYTQYVEGAEFDGAHDGWVSVPGETQRGKGNY